MRQSLPPDLDGLPRAGAASFAKTAGSDLVSTWPTITAVPDSPGLGPRSYQPAWRTGSASGVAMLPSPARPTSITSARTSIDGIVSRVGIDGAGRPSPTRAGGMQPDRPSTIAAQDTPTRTVTGTSGGDGPGGHIPPEPSARGTRRPCADRGSVGVGVGATMVSVVVAV